MAIPRPPPSIHPLKRVERRLRDLLAANVPLWKVADIIEISEASIKRHYRHILDEYDRSSGRKPHEPTKEMRDRVKLLAIAGIPQDDIARVMGFSMKTLAVHYREELDFALIEANSKVAANLLLMATGPRDQKTTATAAIWWTKARMGWKDTSRVENTGADGGPMQIENQVVIVLPDNGRDKTIDGEIDDPLKALPAPEDSEQVEDEED